MKHKISLILLLAYFSSLYADIAPNPIVSKGIYTIDKCNIQMTSEVVNINLSKDSSIVECIFYLKNLGDSITIEIGFPEMNFEYYNDCYWVYKNKDKNLFQIQIDSDTIQNFKLKAPRDLDSIYKEYTYIDSINNIYIKKVDSINNTNYPMELWDKQDSIFNSELKQLDSLEVWRKQFTSEVELFRKIENLKMRKEYPWYVWQVKFEKDEIKKIIVRYTMPTGIQRHNEKRYRYFKYLLNTGSGWKDSINTAEINIYINDNINLKHIIDVSPKKYKKSKKGRTISWNFKNLEPSIDDDIYVKFFDNKEKKELKEYFKNLKKERQIHKKQKQQTKF